MNELQEVEHLTSCVIAVGNRQSMVVYARLQYDMWIDEVDDDVTDHVTLMPPPESCWWQRQQLARRFRSEFERGRYQHPQLEYLSWKKFSNTSLWNR